MPVIILVWGSTLTLLGYGMDLINTYKLQGLISVQVGAEFTSSLMYCALLVALITSVIIYLIVSYSIKHLEIVVNQLAKEANNINDDGSHIIRRTMFPEIEELVRAFDRMREKHHRTVRKLRYQKSKAESVLANLEEGIIILDEEGYILEQNLFVNKYLNLSAQPKGACHISHILREKNVKQVFEKAFKHNEYSSCEIIKNNRTLHLKINLIEKQKNRYGYIITLTDITRTRQLEEIRYQFVSNVTHELKTPLTSIQGFVETLREGAIENPQVARRFLNIIDVEAQRLFRLIQDILLLSEVENMESVCQETVIVNDVINEVVELLRETADTKGIAINVGMVANGVLKQVSRDHMKQIMMNLLSNALRYTDQGFISIVTRNEEDQFIVKITDTGIGIPKESLDRIFERFYTVDKSRSRKSGGTGLGLSITKHIVQLYHGTIEVTSEVGKGSCFTLVFKQIPDK